MAQSTTPTKDFTHDEWNLIFESVNHYQKTGGTGSNSGLYPQLVEKIRTNMEKSES